MYFCIKRFVRALPTSLKAFFGIKQPVLDCIFLISLDPIHTQDDVSDTTLRSYLLIEPTNMETWCYIVSTYIILCLPPLDAAAFCFFIVHFGLAKERNRSK